MPEEYSQEHVDAVAKYLREYGALLSEAFQVAHGMTDNEEAILHYVEGELNYEDFLYPLIEVFEEAEEILDSTEPIESRTREEQLYRVYRREARIPDIPEGHWRDSYSEQEKIENERPLLEYGIDYRSLLRARNAVVLFGMEAGKFDEKLYELVPDIDGNDAEIIEETKATGDEEIVNAPLTSLLSEEIDDSGPVSFAALGEIDSEGTWYFLDDSDIRAAE